MSQASLLDLFIGPASPSELAFIAKSWKESLHDQPQHSSLPKSVFFSRYNPEVNGLLARSQVVVARDTDDPRFAYGFLAYETKGDTFAGHYVYCKHSFRRQGVAKALLDAAIELAGDFDRLVYTTHTRFDSEVEALGFVYCNPFAWERR